VIINPNENKFYNKDIWKDDKKKPTWLSGFFYFIISLQF
jgi:hypothetical protein